MCPYDSNFSVDFSRLRIDWNPIMPKVGTTLKSKLFQVNRDHAEFSHRWRNFEVCERKINLTAKYGPYLNGPFTVNIHIESKTHQENLNKSIQAQPLITNTVAKAVSVTEENRKVNSDLTATFIASNIPEKLSHPTEKFPWDVHTNNDSRRKQVTQELHWKVRSAVSGHFIFLIGDETMDVN